MLESAWLFIGVVAVAATGVCVMTTDNALAMVLGVMGTLIWWLFAYGALDVSVASDAVAYSYTMPSIGLFGIVMSLLPAYVALTGPLKLLERSDTDPRDV